MLRPLSILAVCTMALGAVAGCVNTGGSREQFNHSVYSTHRIMRDIDQNVGPTVSRLNQTTADLNVRMGEIERQLRQVESSLEENRVKLDQLQSLVTEVGGTLRRQTGGVPGATVRPPGDARGEADQPTRVPEEEVQTSVQVAEPVPPPSPVARDPVTLYREATNEYLDGSLENALTLFDEYLERYPDSGKAVDARYWRAMTLREMNRTQESVTEFERIREQYPNTMRAPLAILEAARGRLQLGQYDQARAMFQELIRDYPMTDAADQAQRDLDMMDR